jgi:two-component system response regulator HydG
MEKNGKILIVDDDEDILKAAKYFLEQHIGSVHTESDPKRIPDLIKNNAFDVILLDMNFTYGFTSGKEGAELLKNILEIDPSAVVVMITAYGEIEIAVKAIKEGANDFILKPWNNEKLLATVLSAINLKASRKEVDSLRNRQKQLSDDLDKPYHNFIGESQPMREVFAAIEKVAKTEANVLLLGENGTGKELAARAVHRLSHRNKEPFINVDMGAVNESLFESELFGHRKGAFTDAKDDRAGRFETASGGTLFLDEIGNLSPAFQSKILTVLEKREVIRLGENKSRPIDIRLICATNMKIHEMAEKKAFRRDLLYRINTVEVYLPPLRQRTGDIPLLVDLFLTKYKNKYNKNIKKISPLALKKLEAYPWPGNVRELQHSIERAVIMSDSNTLLPDDFLLSAAPSSEEKIVNDESNLESVENNVIRRVLDKHKGNISKAAEELGLSRGALYRKINKYGI